MWSSCKPLIRLSSILNKEYFSPRLVHLFSPSAKGRIRSSERGSPKPREPLCGALHPHPQALRHRQTYQHLPRGCPILSSPTSPRSTTPGNAALQSTAPTRHDGTAARPKSHVPYSRPGSAAQPPHTAGYAGDRRSGQTGGFATLSVHLEEGSLAASGQFLVTTDSPAQCWPSGWRRPRVQGVPPPCPVALATAWSTRSEPSNRAPGRW